MRAVCVIPARLESSRFPGKVLADVAGKPLVVRAAEAALACNRFAFVVVATDSTEVASAADRSGPDDDRRYRIWDVNGEFACGTDRVAACVSGAPWLSAADVIVNLQADEPEVSPEALATLVGLVEGGAEMATLAANRRMTAEEHADPNFVKVRVGDIYDDIAFAFSRGDTSGASAHWMPHVGAYAFTRDALARFAALPAHPFEQQHRLEQLRWLLEGNDIRVAAVPHEGRGINTPGDLEALLARWHRRKVADAGRRAIDNHRETFDRLASDATVTDWESAD